MTVTGATPARRTNVALLAAVCAVVAVVSAVSILGDRGGSLPDPAPTTTVAPAPVGDGIDLAPATEDDIAYPMETLSCAATTAQVRLDLCGVFDGGAGRFMVTAAEAFWDPAEPDFDGVVRVPLVLNVYVLGGDAGAPSAVPTLTGIIAVPWGPAHHEVGLYEQRSADGDVAVVVWTTRENLRADAAESVLALGWTGDGPRVLASFEPGDALRPLNAYSFPRARVLVGS